MAVTAKNPKIIQRDGVVYYLHPSTGLIPLSRLVEQCGYRIDKLCDALDVSPRHFRRIFDTSLGICPKKYLKSERMVAARRLLRGGLSIKEVSDQLGFNSQKDFYREFREYYDLAPTDFRSRESDRVIESLGSRH